MSGFQWFWAGVAFGAWLVAMGNLAITWLDRKETARLSDEERDGRFRQLHDRSEGPIEPPPPPPPNVIDIHARRRGE